MSFARMVQRAKKKSKNIKILVLGLDNAGKSTLIASYTNNKTICPPTFGYKIISASHGDYYLSILDIGGQLLFKKYWCNYFEGTDAIAFVIDVTDTRSVKPYLEEASTLNVPIAIFYNKVDLIAANITSEFYVENAKIFEVSAIRNVGIREGFDWLVKEFSKKDYS